MNRSPITRRGAAAVLAVTAGAALASLLAPGIDLAAAAVFWRPESGFHLADHPFARFWYHAVPFVRNWIVIPTAAALIVWWAVRRRLPFGIPPRAAVLVAGTLLVGSGFVVNGVLKDHWGRARPRDVERFGGTRAFTPALLPAEQCEDNCSFVSGHSSFVFAGFSLALLARRRALAIAGVVVLGGMAGLGRMMQGAHFLSDVVFSGIVLFLVAWALHRALFRGG